MMAKAQKNWGYVPNHNPGLPVIHTGRSEDVIDQFGRDNIPVWIG